MAIESAARKITEVSAPAYRAAPHNIEAEQALLGAVLVNNEALYRVSETSKYGEGPLDFAESLRRTAVLAEKAQARGGRISGRFSRGISARSWWARRCSRGACWPRR